MSANTNPSSMEAEMTVLHDQVSQPPSNEMTAYDDLNGYENKKEDCVLGDVSTVGNDAISLSESHSPVKKKKHDDDDALSNEDLYPWFNVVLIAISVGAVEYAPLFCLGLALPAKYDSLDDMITHQGLWYMVIFNIILSGACVVGATLLVQLVPCAGASGIPPLIAYLYNGRKTDKNLFSLKMVLVKLVGVVMAIIGGLAIGREGPAILIGAAIGDLTNRLINKSIKAYTGVKVPFNGAVKSNVVMMGATCGFSSAFRSPVGGMLYCVEEIATHWDIRSHMSVGAQTFVASAVAAFTTQAIVTFSSGTPGISFSSIIIFSEEETNEGTTDAAFHYHDLPGFLLTALASGVMAGLITKASDRLRRWGAATTTDPKTKTMVHARNALFVACFTAVAFSLVPLVYTNCISFPDDDHAGDDHHRRLSGGGGERKYVRYTCESDQYSQLASLSLAGEEGVIRHLLSRDDEEFQLIVLVIFLIVYVPVSISARLIPVPAGSFVPNLLTGCLVGRIVGEMMHAAYPSTINISPPGVYALMGAASMLGAWTRTMMAVVVTLLEVTGDIGLVSPLICGVVIARSIATVFADHSYTHEIFYGLIDDPDSDEPLILHPNDWKPQRKSSIPDSSFLSINRLAGIDNNRRNSIDGNGHTVRQIKLTYNHGVPEDSDEEEGPIHIRKRKSILRISSDKGMNRRKRDQIKDSEARRLDYHYSRSRSENSLDVP